MIAQSLPGSGNTITFNGATTYINCGTADRGISKTTITAEAWIKTSSSAIQFAVTKYFNSLFSESGFQLGTSGGQAGTFGRVGLGIPVGLFQLFDKRPQIIINENGIWDRTTNQNEVKWEQIQGAYPLDIYGQEFISLVVDDTFVFKRKQYKWAAKINEAIGAQKLNLHLSQLRIDKNKMTSFIQEMTETEKRNRPSIIKKYFDK